MMKHFSDASKNKLSEYYPDESMHDHVQAQNTHIDTKFCVFFREQEN